MAKPSAGLRERTLDSASLDRFTAKITVESPGCWIWTASTNPQGYGVFRLGGKAVGAHRAAWALLVGSIPPGLEVDHLCRVRNCVNPDHMELVTQKVNMARGSVYVLMAARFAAITECKHGHPFTPENTGTHTGGRRYCKTCKKQRLREYEKRRPPRRAMTDEQRARHATKERARRAQQREIE